MKSLPEERFEPAALGRRIWLILVVVVMVMAIVEVVLVVAPGKSGTQALLPLLGVLPGWLIVGGVWWSSRIQGFLFQDGALVVERRVRSMRFELEGLESVSFVDNPMKGARKVVGNDGLGAVSGRFKKAEWGTFHAYLSDSTQGVVMRWKNGTVIVVSPEHVQPFIDAVKRRVSRLAR